MAEGQQQMSVEEQQAQMQKAQQQEEQRDQMLRALLSADARERLKRIAVVKPEKSRAVENYLISAVRQGRLQPPVDDDKLKMLLEQFNDQTGGGSGPNITFIRKKASLDDDDW
eukprot:TRINITY_DN36413_c0_g1_i1.p1 TRINITY_DN36413_c0_g1~~TRINITY_DN36413_c0_g1_i1.p1  ORF type:complete len:113 (+),score=48.85 TRINITY_DN36413_c0_g1_i1:77-415(+)